MIWREQQALLLLMLLLNPTLRIFLVEQVSDKKVGGGEYFHIPSQFKFLLNINSLEPFLCLDYGII